jgi:hypothetical protein
MGLFPETPMWFRKGIVWPIEKLHRLWWKRLSLHNGWFSEGNRIQSTAGAHSFYATKT